MNINEALENDAHMLRQQAKQQVGKWFDDVIYQDTAEELRRYVRAGDVEELLWHLLSLETPSEPVENKLVQRHQPSYTDRLIADYRAKTGGFERQVELAKQQEPVKTKERETWEDIDWS